jgi:hypothetical protein
MADSSFRRLFAVSATVLRARADVALAKVTISIDEIMQIFSATKSRSSRLCEV